MRALFPRVRAFRSSIDDQLIEHSAWLPAPFAPFDGRSVHNGRRAVFCANTRSTAAVAARSVDRRCRAFVTQLLMLRLCPRAWRTEPRAYYRIVDTRRLCSHGRHLPFPLRTQQPVAAAVCLSSQPGTNLAYYEMRSIWK